MSKTKSITELVTQLQEENESTKYFYKLFAKAVKHEFNYGVDALHKIILKYKAFESKYGSSAAEKQGQQQNISLSEM